MFRTILAGPADKPDYRTNDCITIPISRMSMDPKRNNRIFIHGCLPQNQIHRQAIYGNAIHARGAGAPCLGRV